MHAFEAALFMLGYNVACLKGNFCRPVSVVDAKTKRLKTNTRRSPTSKLGNTKRCKTLVRGIAFNYAGSASSGLRIELGTGQMVEMSPEKIRELLDYVSDSEPMDAGFSRGRNGKRDPDELTFGGLVESHSQDLFRRRLTRQHAARIAAVLVAEDLLVQRLLKRSVQFVLR